MKKINVYVISIIVIMGFLFGSASSVMAFNFRDLFGEYRIGYRLIPIKVSGYKDVHLSDWDTFKILSGESRANIKLSNSNKAVSLHGITAAFRPKHGVKYEAELTLAYNNYVYADTFFGAPFSIYKNKSISVDLVPKVGMSFLSNRIGKLDFIKGTEIDLGSYGTFNKTDEVTTFLLGFAVKVDASIKWMINKYLGTFFTLSYQNANFSNQTIFVGNKALSLNNEAFVEPNESSTTHQRLSAKGEFQNLVYTVGGLISF